MRTVAGLLVAVVLIAGCSRSGDSELEAQPSTTVVTTTTPPPPTTLPPTTTTVPPTTTARPTTTLAPTTTNTPSTTTTAARMTTETSAAPASSATTVSDELLVLSAIAEFLPDGQVCEEQLLSADSPERGWEGWGGAGWETEVDGFEELVVQIT